MMEDFNSETDSDYTSYWRDWVSGLVSSVACIVTFLPGPWWWVVAYL